MEESNSNIKECRNIEVKISITEEEFIELTFFLQEKATISENIEDRLLNQEDVFYKSDSKQSKIVKTRNINNKIFQLIYYSRPSEDKPKLSKYHIVHMKSLDDFKNIKYILENEYGGYLAIIKKRRLLFFISKSRIHLDKVDDLGYFLEIEVVLDSSDSEEDGKVIATNLLKQMNLQDKELIKGSYLDLYNKKYNQINKASLRTTLNKVFIDNNMDSEKRIDFLNSQLKVCKEEWPENVEIISNLEDIIIDEKLKLPLY